MVIVGVVDSGTTVEADSHLVTEQSIVRLLGETCHSFLGSERMCT